MFKLNDPGHMTTMAARAIHSKILKNLLLQRRKAYEFETCHEASMNGALESSYMSEFF